MPIMDGLQATRLIRSFEETGNWDAALQAGIEKPWGSLEATGHLMPSSNRMPIIAVST